MSLKIRPIEPQDNPHLERLVVGTLRSHGYTGPGNAAADPETKNLYTAYQQPRSIYCVVEDGNGRAMGGAGVSQLKGTKDEDGICEMQKLYFHADIQGRGIGKKLIAHLIDDARRMAYKKMYIETVPTFKAAIHLYESFGFTYLPGPLGATGHINCNVWMILSL